MKKKKIGDRTDTRVVFKFQLTLKTTKSSLKKMDKLITIKLFFWGVNYEFK